MKTALKILAGHSPQPSFWSIVTMAQALGLPLAKLAGTTPATRQPRQPQRT
jgi:hypothetical protein